MQLCKTNSRGFTSSLPHILIIRTEILSQPWALFEFKDFKMEAKFNESMANTELVEGRKGGRVLVLFNKVHCFANKSLKRLAFF